MIKLIIALLIATVMSPTIVTAQNMTITMPCPIMPTAFAAYGYGVMPTERALEIEAQPLDTLVGPTYDFSHPGDRYRAEPARVALSCVTWPGGSPTNYALLTQLTTYVTRLGNDGGSQYGALARGVVILHAHSGAQATIGQEFAITRQIPWEWISPDGNYIVGRKQPRGDIRWVQESEWLREINRTYGQRGMATPTPTPVPTLAPVTIQQQTVEQRITAVENRVDSMDAKLDKIVEILSPSPTPIRIP